MRGLSTWSGVSIAVLAAQPCGARPRTRGTTNAAGHTGAFSCLQFERSAVPIRLIAAEDGGLASVDNDQIAWRHLCAQGDRHKFGAALASHGYLRRVHDQQVGQDGRPCAVAAHSRRCRRRLRHAAIAVWRLALRYRLPGSGHSGQSTAGHASSFFVSKDRATRMEHVNISGSLRYDLVLFVPLSTGLRNCELYCCLVVDTSSEKRAFFRHVHCTRY